jgi:hypothetical protein
LVIGNVAIVHNSGIDTANAELLMTIANDLFKSWRRQAIHIREYATTRGHIAKVVRTRITVIAGAHRITRNDTHRIVTRSCLRALSTRSVFGLYRIAWRAACTNILGAGIVVIR